MLGGFQHVIIQAGLHRFHGDLLAACAGEHNHRAIGPACLDRPEHGQAIRPAQLIIRENEIVSTGFERQRETFCVGYLIDFEVVKTTAQFARGEGPILWIVIHQQDVQRVFHGTSFGPKGGIGHLPPIPGFSLRISQYMFKFFTSSNSLSSPPGFTR